eukprot:TRINITY_DN9199_c0_g1_i1.p1 TRINITY_DN9199_c0_g1~~TRINITY_DN9199_c0_g1_i1.p1  ORF type:complete len:427 (-),score=16.86 TRINITY_DN9199_c0_g1_i1:438-1718(-)
MNNTSYMWRLGTLCLLYFVQGAPYGFQTSCLPLILRKQGLTYGQLGALKLLFLPWVCKPLYAPVMEGTKSDLWWLVTSMMTMGGTCFLVSLQDEISLVNLSFILFILNLASATQDITVDSVAIRILDKSELGVGNTIQVVAYKLGAVCVGGSLLWIGEAMGHSYMWSLFSSLYVISVSLVLSLGLIPPKQREDKEENSSFLSIIRNNLGQILRVKNTSWMITFLLFYKLCERGEAVFPIYLVDKKIPLQRLAFWNGIVRSTASISGSAFSGSLLSKYRWSPKSVLVLFSSLRVFALTLQTFIISAWGKEAVNLEALDQVASSDFVLFYVSVLSLCFGNFCAGALTTAAFTAMMNLSQEAPASVRSTHYSLLATVEVLGKLAFATVAGMFIDSIGLVAMFAVFSCLAVATLPILYFMPEMSQPKKSE